MSTYYTTNRSTRLVSRLSARVDCPVITPTDTDYDSARLGWNRTVTASPDVVAMPYGRTDIQAVVRTARELDVPLHVQATGHGTLTSSTSGLLVNLSSMNDVHVDTERMLATVGPGATWNDVNRASAAHGLGSLSGRCGTVGVTGYTLGGGSGWLSRIYGYAADSVMEAEIVTATGDMVTVDRYRHDDLHWAIRGGGGNFGIVSSLTFRLFPAQRVFSGMSFFPAERAADIFRAYRDWSLDEPDGMNTAVLLMRLPPAPTIPDAVRGRQVVALRAFALCDEREGRRQLHAVLQAAGPALHDGFAERGFANASTATNGPDAPPMPHRQLIHLFDSLDDDVIARVIDDEGRAPDSPYAFIELRHWGGAMSEPASDAGPAGHRDTPFSILAVAPYLTPDRQGVDSAVDRLDQICRARATGGSFLTLLTRPELTATAFTDRHFRKLRDIKSRWDPDDIFRPSHHVPALPESTGHTSIKE
ncbi:FAD-binding oxidoreductase [Gordonia sp. NPDC003585]|uniref:FAD-binding oxidoreductase n=1 Tax=Gordonia sp. NPDC003585 TaxID=3154275 RepID=UPI0033B95051